MRSLIIEDAIVHDPFIRMFFGPEFGKIDALDGMRVMRAAFDADVANSTIAASVSYCIRNALRFDLLKNADQRWVADDSTARLGALPEGMPLRCMRADRLSPCFSPHTTCWLPQDVVNGFRAIRFALIEPTIQCCATTGYVEKLNPAWLEAPIEIGFRAIPKTQCRYLPMEVDVFPDYRGGRIVIDVTMPVDPAAPKTEVVICPLP